MNEVFVLCVLGTIMGEVYIRTKRPKLYAFINTGLGVASLFAARLISDGLIVINGFNTALSAILGIPGAALLYFFNLM